MTVSILMCTYNGEKYIKEQLESIYQQNLQPDEVWIIDDCSKDSTVSIIKSFIAEHNLGNCWHCEKNKTNIGYASNFKNGITRVKGDIIFFSDQDDIWNSEKIRDMMEVFEKNKDASVIGTDLIHFYPNGEKKYEGNFDGTIEKVKYKKCSDFIPHPAGCTMAVKRKYILEKMDSYSSIWAHDEFFWRMATVDGCCYRIHKSYMLHRMSGTNVTSIPFKNVSDRMNQAKANMINYDQLYVYSKKINLEKSVIDIIKYFSDGNRYRYDYLTNPKIKKILKLILFKNIYLTKKQFFGDLYYTLIK